MDDWYPFDELEGHDFEYYCAELLENRGFEDVEVTRGSGDYGVDILAEKDGVTYGIQCKRYEGSIGTKAVQEAFSGKAYYDCDEAIVLTNSYFTPQAAEAAEKLGVILWDREALVALSRNRDIPADPCAGEENRRAKRAGALFAAAIVIVAIVFLLLRHHGSSFIR